MKTINWKKFIRKASVALLLITVVMLMASVLAMETMGKSHDLEELHEFFGFTFLILVMVHIVAFRKSLKNTFFV
ncbi:MAG TPA: hypothetical protein PK252_02330 [Bacteroidales bacterium]|nr:hypothetical protein [Bacteroidales bacterium]